MPESPNDRLRALQAKRQSLKMKASRRRSQIRSKQFELQDINRSLGIVQRQIDEMVKGSHDGR